VGRKRSTLDVKLDEKDAPLPGTLRFVMVMGVCFLVGWFLLYLLLQERW
jgi:hypothetical protein